MKKIISALKVVGVWLLIFLMIGVIFEVVLRNISYPGKSTVYYVHHNEFGTWRKPNQKAEKISECFKVDEILVNSYGMRGEEPNEGKKIKVGLFGDSMTEGIQVTEKDHFATRLNEANDTVDYLNFSTSSTTTVYHLLNLKYHDKIFDLDKAVVFLYLANDIQENSIDLQMQMNGKRYYYPSYKPDGHGSYILDYDYRPTDFKSSLMDFLRKSLVFQKLYTIKVAAQQAKIAKASPSASGDPQKSVPFDALVYKRELGPEWEEAYNITDYSILQLKQFCEEKGIELAFVLVPSVGELLERSAQDEMDPLLDWNKPRNYYLTFLHQHDIPVIDLYQAARDRMAESNIKYPFFSYECDGHFAKSGHDLIFDTLKSFGY